ncbi:MAG: porin, partial [Geobacter sp.]
MTISKKLLAVAAAAVLTAATAVPALALENEFHGMYRLFLTQSNFDNSTPAGAGFADNAKSGFTAVQRARIVYTAKANDDLKLVTHFELDSRFGGQQVNTPGTGAAGTGPVNGYKGTYNG